MSQNYIREVSIHELNVVADDCETEWDSIVIYDLDAPNPVKYTGKRTWNSIYNMHINDGLQDIGYHVGVGPDASVWLLRHSDASGYNGPLKSQLCDFLDRRAKSLSIVLAIDCDEDIPTQKAMDKLVYVTSLLADAFKIPTEFIYPHDCMSNPGMYFDFVSFLEDVDQLIGTETDV